MYIIELSIVGGVIEMTFCSKMTPSVPVETKKILIAPEKPRSSHFRVELYDLQT